MYAENDLVRIAKRQNNKKRNYLVVNRLQGKHIPVKPQEAFKMFNELADKIKDVYSKEKILIVGFAETATAIGAAVASRLKVPYIQTTREVIEGVEYLFFSEEHSHATEQKLVKDDIDKLGNSIERIIFVEDEVTTGKTILNIISILEKEYPQIKKFSVASLLNGMDEDSLAVYKEKNISLHYLVKTNHSKYAKKAEEYAGDGETVSACVNPLNPLTNVVEFAAHSYLNARRAVYMEEYDKSISSMCETIMENIDFSNFQNILVIGTEEFMYPALCVAKEIENKGKNVKCHSTTRSPIVVSKEQDYPLHKQFELRSLYDDERITYIYDLSEYDCVLVVTDADYENGKGMKTLLNAIEKSGNKTIYVVRWC